MDKYTKLAKIGKGSFGCAYLAVRKSDPSAKKLVIKEIRMDPRDQQSALREAKLLAALDHPNIIACKESFLLSTPSTGALGGVAARLPPPAQVLCIVTEYADGGDLRKKLERGPRMRESEILDLFVQICLALKHLHDRKIIHRDIKPENVFLMQSNVVKLGDFGVATVLSHTLACAETLTGTPYYTSPEICLGRRYNHKTDVWSLGCVLYELATLTHAFDGRSQRQLFDNIVNANVPPMPASAGVSPRFTELVAEMLRKNPRDRPSVNQIIKKPIVMERIQGFLSQRALADELNHTVLHGHHIFRDKNNAVAGRSALPTRAPVPSPEVTSAKRAGVDSKSPRTAANNVVRRAEAVMADRGKKPALAATPRKKKLGPINAVGGGKSPSVLLKKSRSVKKAAASPTPSRAALDKKRITRATPPAAAAPSPSKSALEQRNRLLLQKKRAVVEKAKQEALGARLVPPPPPQAAAVAPPPPPSKSPPTAVAARSKGAQVADRVSAFNAQWRAQRQQLMQNLPGPPPLPPSQSNNVGALLQPSPPLTSAAPASIAIEAKKAAVDEKKAGEYPKPIVTAAPAQIFVPPPAPVSILSKKSTGAAVVKAAAAKQRDAMRKDILSRKQELKRGGARANVHGARGSPLDDPIILVQNLPDYEVIEPPPSTANTGNSEEVRSPPPPSEDVGDFSTRDEGDANDSDADAGEDGGIEKPGAPTNLEFERMVLQLKSVVECSDLDDEPSDDENESEEKDPIIQPRIPEENEEIEDSAAAACAPLPPAYDADAPQKSSSLTTLKLSTLEDPSFMKSLRALLSTANASSDATSIENAILASETSTERRQTLVWMRDYISTLTTATHSGMQQVAQ